MLDNRVLSHFAKPYKLQFGCGPNIFPGWVNIDSKDCTDADLQWDLREDLPIPQGTVRYIYHEHVMEHFTIEEGVSLLKRNRKLLVYGGVMRIAMPNLRYIIEKYCSRDWRDQEWLTWPQFGSIQTPCEMVNAGMRWWGHQWLYDEEELKRRANEAGYKQVKFCKWGESSHRELCNLETRGDSQLIAEISG